MSQWPNDSIAQSLDPSMAQSALVTGATGFVGSHLVPALRAAGWRVTTLGLLPPADRVGDLATMPLRGLRADVVFHLAAFSNPSASVEAHRETFEANARATARLVREVRAGRFVLASSCAVYGPVPPRDNPVDESRPPRPGTPYAASKLCGEALARAAGRDVVILRPFNHTRPGQTEAYVCPRIARQVARAESGAAPRVIRVDDLAPRRDFFDVRDMAQAYLRAAERGRAGETYNVSTGRPVSIGEIVRLLAARARVPLRLRGKRGPVTILSGDPRRFRGDTGWEARIPLERTLGDLLDWERAHVLRQ